MSVGPMIEKLEKQNAKEKGPLGQHEKPTDSESEVDERWEPDAGQKRSDEFEYKCNCHAELLTSFAHSENLDKAHNWMHKIYHFEQKRLQLPSEYRVIGELMNHLKDTAGKERFIILQKLNRGMRMDQDFIDDKDDILMEKINAIDSKLEEKLAALDYTSGKKGRVLEEEIKELAEERNCLTEEKRRQLYRKGFDTRFVDMNRTCKVTK
ncbi:hypothetical protein MKX03_023815, partial [Papaver bracteatum]